MGLFDAPTATTSGNTSTTTSYPEWTQAFNQAVANAGFNMFSPQLQTSPFQVAGLNPDQMRAFDMTRDMALNAFGPNANLNQATQAAMNAAGNTRAQVAAPMMANAVQVGAPVTSGMANAMAAQLGGGEFAQFMNPFMQNVVDSTVRNMDRQRSRQSAEIGARAAAGGSFGGSREAVQRAALDRDSRDQTSSMVANLMSAGFDRATANALANTQMRQQTNMQNAQQANATLANNQATINNMLQFDAGNLQNTGLTNAQTANRMATNAMNALNNMSQFNTRNAMELPLLLDRLQTSQQARQTNALQALLGVGNQQQAFAQTALDTPLRSLERLMGMAPNVYNTTQTGTSARTAPTGAPSAGQQILGFGLNLLKNPLAKLLGG